MNFNCGRCVTASLFAWETPFEQSYQNEKDWMSIRPRLIYLFGCSMTGQVDELKHARLYHTGRITWWLFTWVGQGHCHVCLADRGCYHATRSKGWDWKQNCTCSTMSAFQSIRSIYVINYMIIHVGFSRFSLVYSFST